MDCVATTTTEARVWDVRNANLPGDTFYIGRPGRGRDGKWGNPFPLHRPLTIAEAEKIEDRLPLIAELGYAHAGAHLNREQALQLYDGYLAWATRNGRLDVRELVMETQDGFTARNLGCFCAPKPCHGDALLRLAKAYAYNRNEGHEHESALEAALYIHITR